MARAKWQASKPAIEAILAARHGDPFAVLGLHEVDGVFVIRALVPNAARVVAVDRAGTLIGPLVCRDKAGFFEGTIDGRKSPSGYRLRAFNEGGAWTFDDPYAFGSWFGEKDDYLLVEGTHRRLYEKLGAHPMLRDGVAGTHFAVWAPRAQRVSVVGGFNDWDGRRHAMRKRIDSGVWEIFAPGVGAGTLYKFEVVAPDGELLPLKADPVGFAGEMRPGTASVVTAANSFAWSDAGWMQQRGAHDPRRAPMSVYEVHPGSWKRPDGRFATYDELAADMIPYVVDLGFTHIELMPVSEHPLDASWGYQPIGLFAPTSRFGPPDGFRRFVDVAHRAGLGILLDWVPAHFPTDQHGLSRFDGAALYEHADPRRGFHPDWNTAIYDFGRREVANVLAANALYWLKDFHIDGLRVDAVASMLYLDYSRKAGEWLPNAQGGNENREAVAFLQDVNRLVYGEHPGAITVAEESTSWPGVSKPAHEGGLGFGFKWNMGWMHDTLEYMALDPVHRRWHHDKMTFGLLYAYAENFVLPLSHDEVVHGKGSLLEKMSGDDWQKFAALRAYYGFMWAYPGKKLLFMGQEFAQRREWNFDAGLDWDLLNAPAHRGVSDLVRDLNRLHKTMPALHARDCEPEGFQWIVADDAANSVYAWMRHDGAGGPPIVAVSNFTPVPRHPYRLGLPHAGFWRELMNTDSRSYGGSDTGNLGGVTAYAEPLHGQPASASIILPPLGTLYFQWKGQ